MHATAVRGERERLPIRLLGLERTALSRKESAEGRPGFCIARVISQQSTALGFRLCDSTRLVERQNELKTCSARIRMLDEDSAIQLLSFGEPAHSAQKIAEVDAKATVLGLELDAAPQ